MPSKKYYALSKIPFDLIHSNSLLIHETTSIYHSDCDKSLMSLIMASLVICYGDHKSFLKLLARWGCITAYTRLGKLIALLYIKISADLNPHLFVFLLYSINPITIILITLPTRSVFLFHNLHDRCQ